MSEPPSKRRRTNSPADAPTTTRAEDGNDNNNSTAAPELLSSVSHRQSFQSPTRSSLARSNPEVLSHLLAREPSRSPQRLPRSPIQRLSFGLRDRKAVRPSLAAPTESSPLRALSQSPRRVGAVAGAQQQQVFAVPPRRISRKLDLPRPSVVSEVGQGSEIEENAAQIPPTKGEEEEAQTTPVRRSDPDEQLASELDSATRELESAGLLAPSALDYDLPEPELPPTSTAVAREKRPKASQEILSSPSAGRKLRRDLLRPSNLTAANNAPAEVVIEADDNASDDPAVQEQKRLKKELDTELDQLKADVMLLENWANQVSHGNNDYIPERDGVSRLVSLLSSTKTSTSQGQSTDAGDPLPISNLVSSLLPFASKSVPVRPRAASPEPINAFALNEAHDPKPYLTAFAPLSLDYTTTPVISRSQDSSVIERHEIHLSATAPFSSKHFQVPLQFTTNLQTQQITSVSLAKRASAKGLPPALKIWIESRIANPILGLDVSGICIGISRFWEASIDRARIWARLRNTQELLLQAQREMTKKKKKISDIRSEFSLSGAVKRSDLRFIIPHLQRSSMLFSCQPEEGASSMSVSKFILSCPLTLDQWTSEAQLKPDISIHMTDSGTSRHAKIEAELKRLFNSILRESGAGDKLESTMHKETTAIVRATEAVMSMLFDVDV